MDQCQLCLDVGWHTFHVLKPEDPDRCPGSRVRGPHLLADLSRVALHEVAGDIADSLRASERRPKHQPFGVVEQAFELGHDGDVGASKAVDACQSSPTTQR